MNEYELELALLGSIKEIIQDRKLFHYSNVGADYSHLTPEGVNAVANIVGVIAPHLRKAQDEALDARAKALVLKELKS